MKKTMRPLLRPQLAEAILANSLEKYDLKKAILEWDVIGEYKKKKNQCVCTQYPITHCSIIKNRITGKILDPIGNECIRHFGNLSDQLEKLLKKDNKMVGKYAGLSFEDVAKLHPEYRPNEYECDQYKTCRKYCKYRDFVLQDYDDAITRITSFIMPIIGKQREEKRKKWEEERRRKREEEMNRLPQCVCCQDRFHGEEWQYLCRKCFCEVGTWVKDDGQWLVKLSRGSRHHVRGISGKEVSVDVVSRAGKKTHAQLNSLVRFEKGYALWSSV